MPLNWLLFGAFLFVGAPICLSIEPALLVHLNEPGLEYFREFSEKTFKEVVAHLTIPELLYDDDSQSFELKEMVIVRYSDPKIRLTLRPPNVLGVNVRIPQLEARGRYGAMKKIIKKGFLQKFDFLKKKLSDFTGLGVYDHGIFMAAVGYFHMYFEIQVLRDEAGRFKLKSTTCEANMADLDMDLQTNKAVDWLLRRVRGPIAAKLKPIAEKKLCENSRLYFDKSNADPNAVLTINRKRVQSVNEFLKTIPPVAEMVLNFSIDTALVRDPKIEPTYIETAHSGEIIYLNRHPVPFQPRHISFLPTDGKDRMVYAWASDFMINSALYHSYMNGLFSIQVDKVSNPELADYLKTDCWLFSVCLANLWPTVGTSYPNSVGIFKIDMSAPPQVEVKPDGILAKANGLLNILLEQPGVDPANYHRLLNTAFTFEALVVPKLDGAKNRVYIELNMKKLKFDIREITDMGKLTKEKFAKMLTQLGWPVIEFAAGAHLSEGFPIEDTLGVHLINPSLKLREGVIEFGTELNYTLPVAPIELIGGAVLEVHNEPEPEEVQVQSMGHGGV